MVSIDTILITLNDYWFIIIAAAVIAFFLILRKVKQKSKSGATVATPLTLGGEPIAQDAKTEEVVEGGLEESDVPALIAEFKKQFGKDEDEEDGDVIQVAEGQVKQLEDEMGERLKEFNKKFAASRDKITKEEKAKYEEAQKLLGRLENLRKTKDKLALNIRNTKISEK